MVKFDHFSTWTKAALLLAALAPAAAMAMESRPGEPRTSDPGVTFNLGELARGEAAQGAPKRERWAPPRMRGGANTGATAPGLPFAVPPLEAGSRNVAARSPAPATSFAALGDDDSAVPPDTQGAVGPSHVMAVLNTEVRVQTRQGAEIMTVKIGSFFGGATAFDPKVTFDALARRWVVIALANVRSPTSALHLAVSETDDPTKNWFRFSFDVDAANIVWGDYPGLGYNKDWIVVTVKLFTLNNDSGGGTDIYVFNKADAYANGGANSQADFTLLKVAEPSDFMAPAITFDSSLSTFFLVDTFDSAAGTLRLSTITGAVGSETINMGVATPASGISWDYSPPVADFNPQSGTTTKISTGDARMLSCVFRNGSIWCVHTILLPAGGPNRIAVQWWQFDTSGNVQQRGLIDDPAGNTFYDFPSLAVNKDNDVLIGYSRFSASQFVSANYSFRAGSDAPNTLRPDTVLKEGESSYVKGGGPPNRWGDYSATCVDPVNDTDLWTIQEYAAARAFGLDRWGTWWGMVSPPSNAPTPPAITSSLSVSATISSPFTYAISASGTQPITFNASPMPPGLSFSGSNISGTPSELGSYAITLSANNSVGSDSKMLILMVNEAVGGGGTGGGFAGNAAGTTVESAGLKKKFTLKFSADFKDSIDVTISNSDFFFTDKFAFSDAVNGRRLKIFLDRTEIDSTTLDARGGGFGAGTVKWNPKKGAIRYTLKNASLSGLLAPFGAVNADVSTAITIPMFFEIEGVKYGGEHMFLYTARAGSEGSGK